MNAVSVSVPSKGGISNSKKKNQQLNPYTKKPQQSNLISKVLGEGKIPSKLESQKKVHTVNVDLNPYEHQDSQQAAYNTVEKPTSVVEFDHLSNEYATAKQPSSNTLASQ